MNKAPTLRHTAAMKKQEAQWRAEDDLRSLIAAAEIRKDKARLAAAKAIATEKLAELKKATESL